MINESAHDNTLYFSLELLEPRSLITVLLQFLPSRVLEERLISSGHAIAASAFGYNEWKNDYCKDRGVVKSVVDIFLFRRSISSSFDGRERERYIPLLILRRYSVIPLYIYISFINHPSCYLPRRLMDLCNLEICKCLSN